MNTIADALASVFAADLTRIILSKPRGKTAEYKKLTITQKTGGYQVEKLTDKQVFHQNIGKEEALEYCASSLYSAYQQLNAWSAEYEYTVLVSRQGKVSVKKSAGCKAGPVASTEHNRKKNYILREGESIPPLVDMGIFTKEGKVVRPMYDKFKQINRFIELIDDSIDGQNLQRLNVIDFGCGKSYLTFVLYYYFTQIKNIPVNIIGLDLKADVIEKCNETARRYGYNNLRFELGDINGYRCDLPVDLVITLHACDTATDYALYNAVEWGAKMIFSVPCCQHEANAQMRSEGLALFTRYGIVQERVAALVTDAMRGNLLEACGYKTQILEFIDAAHTPKNLLLRAVKRPVSAASKKKALSEVESAMREFNLKPTFYTLLEKSGRITAAEKNQR